MTFFIGNGILALVEVSKIALYLFSLTDNVCGTLYYQERNLLCTIGMIVFHNIVHVWAIISLRMTSFTRNTENLG